MGKTVIAVRDLSKEFIIAHENNERYTALRDVVAKRARTFFSLFHGEKRQKITKESFWALKDISFEINEGDRVGIIGRNGAGKSTLLKVLSRITEPTKGSIKITGRVSSLLEVGTGFHPELTGRENIFLNGAILGMNRNEIRAKFDEIVDFAEVEQFLDTPVKRYSSGMYVRLAFAVAAHLEPEILIVDEVLAVGDMRFQRKCLGKMNQVSKENGRTVLFVSHNIESINRLCNRGILLEQGRILSHGPISEVIDNYQLLNDELNSDFTKSNGIIRSIRVIATLNNDGNFDLIVNAKIELSENIVQAVFGVLIKDINDNSLIAINNKHYFNNELNLDKGSHTIDFKIPALPLSSNTYKLDVFFGTGATDIEAVIDKVYFTVKNDRNAELHPLDQKLNRIYVKEIDFKIKKHN